MSEAIAGIVLAAGAGKRAGQPKATLLLDDRSLLEIVCDNCREAGLERIVVVVSSDLVTWVSERELGAMVAINPVPEMGMLSSVRIGLDCSPEACGYLIMPVDHPYVRSDTLQVLIETFRRANGMIIRPTHGGVAGHPIVLPSPLARFIPHEDTEGGLGAIIRRSRIPMRDVSVDDPGVLRNVNYLADLS